MNKSEIFVTGIFLIMLGLLVAIVVADAEKVMVKSVPYKDSNDSEYIYSESFADDSLGGAIMNRMIKAAAYNIVEVV